MKLPIYLDYSATTPVDPRVAQKMIPYLTEIFGNPASRSHAFGWKAEEGVEEARGHVAALLNADPKDIVWTSGATEGNNLAIKGAAQFYKTKGKHLITQKTEHKAVLDTFRELERQGFEATYLDVQPNGLVDIDKFKAAIRPDTILASIMMVNNEIGVIQPVWEIADICKQKGIIFHCDAVQGGGRVEIDMNKLRADLLTITAHKMYGPKGIGALYVRRKPRVRLEAQIHGGGHERGFRSGTLATHQIVGFGEAARLAKAEMATDNERIRALRDKLWKSIQGMEEVYLNGDLERRIPHNLNASFNFVEGESLIMAVKDIAVSSGSACTSASLEPSYVLRALGRNDELAHSSIRITLGRFTTEQEVDYAADLIKRKVAKLRELSPLWEMYKEGVDLMRRRDEAADQGRRRRRHRGRALQDLRLRLGHRLELARHRMGEGQDARPGRVDQEHANRAGALAAAGEDPLLDPGRGRDQGGGRGLQEEAWPRRRDSRRGEEGRVITLTENAAKHVQSHLAKRGKGVGLRVGVRTSGCSGMAYKLEYADNVNPEDMQFESHGVKVIVDPKSLPYLLGTELDYAREGLNEGFKFHNPNVKDECGCGESFNV